MASEGSIEAGARRLNAAMDALEVALGRQQVTGKAIRDLEQEMQTIAQDRSRLAQELDRLKQRNVKLEAVSDEVSRRLESAIATIESMIDSAGR